MKPYLLVGVLASWLVAVAWIAWQNEKLNTANNAVTGLTVAKEALELKIQGMDRDRKFNEELIAEYENRRGEIRYVDRIVTKTVVEYRDRVVDRVVLPAEWVCAYNLSTMRVPEAGTTCQFDGTTARLGDLVVAPVDDARVLDVVTYNNRLCVSQATQLRTLQRWASEQEDIP